MAIKITGYGCDISVSDEIFNQANVRIFDKSPERDGNPRYCEITTEGFLGTSPRGYALESELKEKLPDYF